MYTSCDVMPYDMLCSVSASRVPDYAFTYHTYIYIFIFLWNLYGKAI